MNDPEICIVAAVRTVAGRVIRCHRHFYGLHIAGPEAKGCEQGFVTSRNRFVDREEGQRIQLAAGMDSIAPGGYRGDNLYSEDLY